MGEQDRFLSDEEIAAGKGIGQVIMEALDDMPADWYELVWIADKVYPSGLRTGLQPVVWPMKMDRQGNVSQGIVPPGEMWGRSPRKDH